ncbi:MAG: MmgE/PrpD family protein [Candidatus Caldarchaeum sp.]|nr:MmgE/PrpD family protein [Candidatus Caldarchaeum sp.]
MTSFDSVTREIAEFASGHIILDEDVLHEVRRRVLDSVGCFFGAWDEEAVVAARKAVSKHVAKADGSSLWGTNLKTSPDWAGFVNGVGVRALDFNDTYLSKEPLHPSDMIPSIIAIGEAYGAGGKEVAEAIAVGYEVGCRLCDAATLRKRGWDHVNFTMIGAVAGISRLMNLDYEKTANAVSLAVVPHAAMRQTRAGELSMWKGAAAANACRNAVSACMLAESGMTGPSQPFEGEMGFFKQVAGTSFSIEGLGETVRPRKILETYIKFYPVEYHAMTAVDAALKALEKAGSHTEIEKVRVETFEASYTILAKDPEKWRPTTRETADHSLPYIVSVTFLDGGVWLDSFEKRRITSPDVGEFMKRVEIVEDAGLTARYPAELPNRIILTLKNGEKVSVEEAVPRGHYKNPMTDEEIERKFQRLAAKRLDEARRKEIISKAMNLEKLNRVSELTEAVAIP